MTPPAQAHLEVIPATPEQAPLLSNLLELYAHDFSEFRNLDLDENGRFGYPSLLLYWSDPQRHPFLITLNRRPAGLVLVKKGSDVTGNDAVWDMAEFFIIRGCRRRGIGTQAAHQVWSMFPGLWEVRVMPANLSARRFWAHAVARFAGESIHPATVDYNGESWILFSFESKRIT